ncbi:MAG TPA: patatin-like phospholipase family protein [Bacteroidales bacterium]|nr:patatin-like phospholipase family protein [Bacteroidales bacterium]
MFKIRLVFILFLVCCYSVSAQQPLVQRPKIGVVLSGGGAKGLAHIGVLKVLEEAGIPIDYIAGTSMGSIIGGLYAIGYSSHQLDSITRSVNWEELLTDKVSRRNLSMMEKDENVKYLLSFPIQGKRIILPNAMVTGQNISTFFSSLCLPVYDVTDFSKFKIPYFCVAADIEKGQPIVLKSGNLAEAMRASMAIPTVFSPEVIDSIPLLDGGLLNNFPVKELKEMGADIIIGVDVGFRYHTKKELNSLVRIIEQSIFMHTRERNDECRNLCDILIDPDLTEFNSSSFNHADTLIARGEKAARGMYDKLAALSERLRQFPEPVKVDQSGIKQIDSVYIDGFDVVGLNRVPKSFFERKLSFQVPGKVGVKQIEHFIENMYGTWFFEKISYRLENSQNGVKLTFNVEEKNTNYFRVGLHYDSDFKTSLVLNTTFRNVFTKGSKLSMDLALGDNPSFTALYFKNSGWKPKYNLLFWTKLIPDYGFLFQAKNIEVYEFNDDRRTASYNFVNMTSDFFIQANISNSNIFGLGLRTDYSAISGKIFSSSGYDSETYFLDLHSFYKIDSYNQTFFPSKGIKLCSEFKYTMGLSKNVKNLPGFFQVSIKSSFIQSLTKRLSLIEGIYGGTFFGDSLPTHYRYYLGGMAENNLRENFPFVGMDFMQRSGSHALAGRLHLQWEILKDNFITLRSNIGKTSYDRKELIKASDILFGYGASFGYRSPIGPMEVTIMHSNVNSISAFINIGFWF